MTNLRDTLNAKEGRAQPARYWMGTTPLACDHCETAIVSQFHDARMSGGLWGGMWGCFCDHCFASHGLRHGVGLGQRYTQQPNGRWLKTAG